MVDAHFRRFGDLTDGFWFGDLDVGSNFCANAGYEPRSGENVKDVPEDEEVGVDCHSPKYLFHNQFWT